MAITFSIPTTEIVITSGQTEVLCQDILNAARVFEDQFMMMGFDHIVDAGGKLPIDLVGGIYTEIVLSVRYPWTIRFEDEDIAHCRVKGGTLLAFDQAGSPRPVSTNFGLTISQSISGVLVVAGGEATDEMIRQIRAFLFANRLELDETVGENMIVYKDDDQTPWIKIPVRNKAGGAITIPGGAPAIRPAKATIEP